MTTYHQSPSSIYPSLSSPTHEYRSPISDDVPSSVQNLLLSTKHLQEALRKWSVGQTTEGDVSDLYVKIGNELNLTISAFAQHKIDMSDVHSIPADLRVVLENCLSEDPSPEVLDRFMPEVRHVLYKLLKCLQNRQESWQLATRRPMYPSRSSQH